MKIKNVKWLNFKFNVWEKSIPISQLSVKNPNHKLLAKIKCIKSSISLNFICHSSNTSNGLCLPVLITNNGNEKREKHCRHPTCITLPDSVDILASFYLSWNLFLFLSYEQMGEKNIWLLPEIVSSGLEKWALSSFFSSSKTEIFSYFWRQESSFEGTNWILNSVSYSSYW